MKRLPLAVVLLALLAIIALAVFAWMLLAPKKISAARTATVFSCSMTAA